MNQNMELVDDNPIVYTTRRGWKWAKAESGAIGWRKKVDGKRAKVQYYIGEGWLTESELYDLRQTEPRTAP